MLFAMHGAFAHISTQDLHRLTNLPQGVLNGIMRNLDRIEREAEGGWSKYYHVFPGLIKRYNLKIGVEIGVSTGGHSESILRTTDVEKLYSIDPWIENPVLHLGGRSNYDVLFYRVRSRLAKYGERSVVIRNFSYNVVNQFDDASLDYIFIDGNHHYEAVKQDLEMWYPKLRAGGVMGGDDYATSWPGVPKAVNEFFEKCSISVNQDQQQKRIWWVKKP